MRCDALRARLSRRRPRASAAIAAALVLAVVAGCRKMPPGPALVLVTVEGLPDGLGDAPFLHELARVATRFEGIQAPDDVFHALAALHAGLAAEDLPSPPGAPEGLEPPLGPGAPLPAAVDTWLERAASLGFETAAAVPRGALGVASGLTQGAVHVEEGPDSRAAFEWAVQFLDGRLARRRDPSPVLWLHLDLDDFGASEAGEFLDSSLARLSATLETDPHHVLAVWFLPDDGAFDRTAPFWIRVRGSAGDRTEEAQPHDLAPTIAARIGAEPPPRARPPFTPFAGRDLLPVEEPR